MKSSTEVNVYSIPATMKHLKISNDELERLVDEGTLETLRSPDGTLSITQESAEAYKKQPKVWKNESITMERTAVNEVAITDIRIPLKSVIALTIKVALSLFVIGVLGWVIFISLIASLI